MENHENKVVCPYCKEEQNPLNIPSQLFTSRTWVPYECEKCKKLFGYIQVVSRSYLTVELEGQ